MKIFVVVGTRPEAIKMVPVYRALQNTNDCTAKLLLTGQHREMARSVLNLFQIKADIDLDVMETGQTLLSLTANLTSRLSEIITAEKPDAILVQGDTTSALLGGLLGFYAGCRVGHVEAGLRTGNLKSPYPEEFNRRVIALATHWHFAPTNIAAKNLRSEGFLKHVHIVGNTVIDAALQMAEQETYNMRAISARLPFLENTTRRKVLVTTHRRENFFGPMENIAGAVADLARAHSDVDFVVPVHPNPAVGLALRPALESCQNVHLIAPLEYDEMIYIIRNAYLVLTDSGGIQEEAPTFGVPVLVLRNETERIEGIEAGCSKLVGTDRATILRDAHLLLVDETAHTRMAKVSNPYGDGKSAQQIARIIGGAK